MDGGWRMADGGWQPGKALVRAVARMRRVGLIAPIALLASAATASVAEEETVTFPAAPADVAGATQVSVTETVVDGQRMFVLTSTAPQREDTPSTRVVKETPDTPQVATGSTLFDALFAMAVDDARLDSVFAIRDPAYNDGASITCQCFQTGEKWAYVWTRDLSYALDLGLAGFDPARARASLLFKTSPFRAGVPVPAGLPAGSLQIMQDTGSGGSWPVSTDRTTWALGAVATLANLSDPERRAFEQQSYAALKGTIEADRLGAYDPHDGLYSGEHSFLDWREQSYAAWVAKDLSALAQSKALSTNIVQLEALRLAATLGRTLDDDANAQRYARWATQLQTAVNAKFWDADAQLYATYTTAEVGAPRVEKYDMLGNALAILSGIADQPRAREILSHYPFAAFGPPVLWPQEPGVAIYHNRAIWPFVTAYALRAAAKTGHVAAADQAIASILRGAAINLSNMENLDWVTGRAITPDGPVINSRRQLWSVAAYYGMVVQTIFGFQPRSDGLHLNPFLTAKTRRMIGSSTARLSGLRYAGKPVEIVLRLPPSGDTDGIHKVTSVELNGRAIHGAIPAASLNDAGNRLEIGFGPARATTDRVTAVPPIAPTSRDDPRGFMPPAPTIASVERSAGTIHVDIHSARAEGSRFSVWRDGYRIATNLPAGEWIDRDAPDRRWTVCYSARAHDTVSGFSSQPAEPRCVRGTAALSVVPSKDMAVASMDVPSGMDQLGRKLLLGHKLAFTDVTVRDGGWYAISLRYHNHVNDSSTGITNAAKLVAVVDTAGRRQGGVIQMPHIADTDGLHPVRSSTRVYVRLMPGQYRVTLSDFFNMSFLSSNATYSGAGGSGGPVSEAWIRSLELDPIASPYRAPRSLRRCSFATSRSGWSSLCRFGHRYSGAATSTPEI